MNETMVHIVDDDAALRDSAAFLLSSAAMQARTYDTALKLLERANELEAGCIVTDVRMPEMNGLELIEELARLGVRHPIIVITGHADVKMAVAAMKAGATDFLEKPLEDEAFIRAVRAALERNQSEAAKSQERAAVEQRLSQLTARERDVFHAVTSGDSNKSAALKLGISPRTVEIYRANVMSKMGAGTLSDLVRMALILDAGD